MEASGREVLLGRNGRLPTGFFRESVPLLKEILDVALPNMASFVLGLVNELTNLVFIGHNGTDVELAAVGLGNMIQNCVALSIAFGICAAMDTLVSQAFGADQHEMCCVHLQRGRVVMTLQLVWMAPLLWFSGDLLEAIGQTPAVARSAGLYNRATLLGLVFLFQGEAFKKFLVNRRCTMVPAIITLIVSLLHPIWCAIFISHLKLGNLGAGYANSMTWFLSFSIASLYLWHEAPSMGLRWQDVLLVKPSSLVDWMSYARLALPATVQMCSEWWFWEICALVVGYLGPVELAAHVSALNLVALLFMPATGLSVSAATLVGNALGAGEERKAKLSAAWCVGLMPCIWTPVALTMLFGSRSLAAAYTDDADVRELAASLFRIYALIGFPDSAQAVMGGVLRGMARQDLAAGIYILCFYGIMMPLGVILAFPGQWRVYGIWTSFLVGTGLACTLIIIMLLRIRWQAVPEAEPPRPQPSPGLHVGVSLADIGTQLQDPPEDKPESARANGSESVRAKGSESARANGSESARANGSEPARANGSESARASGSESARARGKEAAEAGGSELARVAAKDLERAGADASSV